MGYLVALMAIVPMGTARATEPLDYIPDSVQIVATIDNPRKLVEAFTTLDAAQEAKQLAPVKALLDSTAAHRFFQMLGHIERELGAPWPELLDQLAGRGIAIAGHFGDGKPALLVVQGTDEKQTARAFDRFLAIVGDELQRQGLPLRPKSQIKNGTEFVAVGDFHAARTGSTIVVSNKADFLDQALRVAAARMPGSIRTKKSFVDASKLLPKNPLVKLWIDFASVKNEQSTKDFFAATRKDFLQTLVVGGTIDCLRRSEFIVAGLFQEKGGLRFAVRLPAGRSEFPPEFALHVPEPGQHGSLPLLEPPGVVASQSIYLDLGYYWKHRDKLIGDEMRKQLEMGEQQVNKILPGNVKLGELLEMWGPYHRGVVLNHDKLPYKTIPTVRFPAFGYVASMRDPKFNTSMDTLLRQTGLFLSLVYGLKQSEHTHDGVKIVAYRFSETKVVEADPEGIRFNFEPCYAAMDDQFVAATTVEACKKLITEVRRTAKLPPSPAVWRGKAFAAGGQRLLYDIPDPFVTDAILTGGLSLDDARKQVDAIAAWLKKRGTVRIEIDEAKTTYKFDIVWTK
ncbi:MAG TPA: hypothetical protein VN641_13930 [Urbifossiella sp.]|nr:hypothetical protein [Urbifossiella sp.]